MAKPKTKKKSKPLHLTSREKTRKFGTLIDAVITEPFKVDYFKFQVDGVQYSEEDFEKAIQMKKAFMRGEIKTNQTNFKPLK